LKYGGAQGEIFSVLGSYLLVAGILTLLFRNILSFGLPYLFLW